MVKSINNTIKYSLGGNVEANYIIKNAQINTPTKNLIEMNQYGETGTNFNYTATNYTLNPPIPGVYNFIINIKNEGKKEILNSLNDKTINPTKIILTEIKNSQGNKFLYIKFLQIEKANNYQIDLFDKDNNIIYSSILLKPIFIKDKDQIVLKENQTVKIYEPRLENENRYSRWKNSSQKLYDIKKIKVKSILNEENNNNIQSISETEYHL